MSCINYHVLGIVVHFSDFCQRLTSLLSQSQRDKLEALVPGLTTGNFDWDDDDPITINLGEIAMILLDSPTMLTDHNKLSFILMSACDNEKVVNFERFNHGPAFSERDAEMDFDFYDKNALYICVGFVQSESLINPKFYSEIIDESTRLLDKKDRDLVTQFCLSTYRSKLPVSWVQQTLSHRDYYRDLLIEQAQAVDVNIDLLLSAWSSPSNKESPINIYVVGNFVL